MRAGQALTCPPTGLQPCSFSMTQSFLPTTGAGHGRSTLGHCHRNLTCGLHVQGTDTMHACQGFQDLGVHAVNQGCWAGAGPPG